MGRRPPESEDEREIARKNIKGEEYIRLKFKDLYSLKGLLGIGSYGVVLLVNNRRTDEQNALKIIYKSKLKPEEIDIIKGEGQILRSLTG